MGTSLYTPASTSIYIPRSAEISEAIEELDNLREQVFYEDEHADPWDALASSEIQWIECEIERCARDIRYACYNYFWLGQTKEAKPTLFHLWPTQELFLSVILDLWARGLPAWLICHKARQIGFSSVVEGALMAWKTLFFDNQICAIIAQDPKQAEHLFKIVQYVHDHVPWWMKPMEASREFKEAMILENPDPFERSYKPGLNNWIIANGCNKLSSFMQGKPIHGLHGSEISSWAPARRALEILEGDSKYALVEKPGCFAVLESKPKGVGGYWWDLWHTFDKAGYEAEYFPFFVPAFFEKDRKKVPPPGWQADAEMVAIREEFAKEWHECKECGTPVPMRWGEPKGCFRCNSTNHEPIILTDDQLYWYQRRKKAAEDIGDEELKLFFQEMCITPEEGFQHSGISVFPDDVMQRLRHTCKPGERGYFDDTFQWHAATNCKICRDDHWHGKAAKHLFEEFPCQIWELPREGASYVMGIDVAEGMELGDYSCIHVIRIGRGTEIPDSQVCEWHGRIDGYEFARTVYMIGKAYHEALAAIDAYGPGYGTQGVLMKQFQYPNIYRWKHLDNVRQTPSVKAGVWPNYKTKRTMITWAIRWLRRGFWEIHSPRFLEEAPFFVKDEEESQARALQGQYDDAVSAALYAIYAAHEDDTDPKRSRIDIPSGYSSALRTPCWTATCVNGHEFDSDDPRGIKCPKCEGLIKGAIKKLPKAAPAPGTIAGLSLIEKTESVPKGKNFSIPNFEQL